MKNALLVIPLLAAGVLAAGVLAAGCGPSSSSAAGSVTSSASSASAVAAAGTPACLSADLQVSIGGGPGSGMSQNHTGLQLRNTGSSACSLYGYPGVSWVAGADGHQVGPAAAKQADSSGAAETTVTLVPGAVASAPLDFVDPEVFSKSACKPVPVRGLRVYPPGETAAMFLSLPTEAGGYGECSAATMDPELSIGYLQAGAQPGNDGKG